MIGETPFHDHQRPLSLVSDQQIRVIRRAFRTRNLRKYDTLRRFAGELGTIREGEERVHVDR